MDSIRIDIAGDRQAGIRFDAFPDALYDDLRAEIESLAPELYGRIQDATPVDQGDLLSKERMRVFTDKERITGYVDVSGSPNDIRKAGALEYGSRGRAIKVSSHSMSLDHAWSQKLDEPISVLVDAYNRTPNIAQHAFERGSLAAMQPEVIARLNAVVEKAVAQVNA